jgi:hypothetical protein
MLHNKMSERQSLNRQAKAKCFFMGRFRLVEARKKAGASGENVVVSCYFSIDSSIYCSAVTLLSHSLR